MTTSIPPSSQVPKSSGNRSLVILVLLMFGAAGGRLFFKLSGEDKPAVPAPPPSAKPPPVIDQVIPPPPPPPEPSASVEPEPKKKPPTKVTTGCSTCGSCTGTEAAGFRGALAGRAALAQRCYEKALGQTAGLEGKLTLGVCVGVGGQVCSASIVKDSLGSPLVSQCVLNIYRATTFPSPKNGCVDAQIPMNFVAKKL
jgi:outer membrane biosynthesis protein TonB